MTYLTTSTMDSELSQSLGGTLDAEPNVRMMAELRIGELLLHTGLSGFHSSTRPF